MLFVALSCLQGRPMGSAFEALTTLGADGVQLTPGNQPTEGFAELTAAVPTRTHHGFTFRRWKQHVWASDGRCLVDSDSVHPPLEGKDGFDGWWAWLRAQEKPPVVETMYPGYALGCGAQLDEAMDAQLRLAVDISHVFIQRHAGVIGEPTWRRLQDYPHIAEIHVSKNPGTTDAHQPLSSGTFGLEWAKAKLRVGTPVILESYFHRLSQEQRRAQVALVLG